MVRSAWLVALVVLALDQAVKDGLRGHLAPCPVAMALSSCARLPLLAGVALGRAESNGGLPGLLPFFSLATLVAVLGLLLVPLYARWLRHTGRLGALSNLADRLLYGTHLDYILVGRGVFNLADLPLLLGTVLAVPQPGGTGMVVGAVMEAAFLLVLLALDPLQGWHMAGGENAMPRVTFVVRFVADCAGGATAFGALARGSAGSGPA